MIEIAEKNKRVKTTTKRQASGQAKWKSVEMCLLKRVRERKLFV